VKELLLFIEKESLIFVPFVSWFSERHVINKTSRNLMGYFYLFNRIKATSCGKNLVKNKNRNDILFVLDDS
jgi:uncharacterized protein involved in propanediol utilization